MNVRALRSWAGRRPMVARALARVRNSRDRRFESALRFDPEAPALLLSPHLDDAALSCWSVLTGPDPVTVVNVFAGSPSTSRLSEWDRLSRASRPAARMEERFAEDAEALGVAGRSPVNLSFLDDQYRAAWRRPALRELDAAVAARVPAASRVLAPLGVLHPDHKLVQRHAVQLRRRGLPVTLYAEVPQAAMFGWPHWATGVPEDPHLAPELPWQDALARAGLDPSSRARVVRLSTSDSESKLLALRAYRTQFPALDGGALGILRNRDVRDFELFWDLR